MGDVTNTAARVQSRAEWGEVLITERVRDHLSGVAIESRGSFRAKGKSAAISVYALKSHRGAEGPDPGPLIGRTEELGRLERCLESARRGRGVVAAVEGEAGIGKSRLKRELCSRARAQGLSGLRG